MQRGGHGQLRPPVGGLPDEVGRPDDRRDAGAEPWPSRAQHGAVLRDEDAEREAGQQHDHQVVGLEPSAGRGARAKPPVRTVPQQGRGDAQQDRRPGQQLGRRGVADVGSADDDRGARRGQSGEHPAEPARAEQRRQPGRDHHDRAARQRRDDPDRRRADAEDVGDPGEQRDERRLVDVAEREMAAGHDEVQLVLLESVPAAYRELDRHEHAADHPHEHRDPVGTGDWCRPVRRKSRDGGLRGRGGGFSGLVHDVASRAVLSGNTRQAVWMFLFL